MIGSLEMHVNGTKLLHIKCTYYLDIWPFIK